MYIYLLDKEFETVSELERFLNCCRIEYVEQKTGRYNLSPKDALSIYALLEIKEKIKNEKDSSNRETE